MRKSKLYERLLDEKDKHIRILIAEIDYLRATRGQPSLPATITTSGISLQGSLPEGAGGTIDNGDWVSEADEAEKILADQGLSRVHLPEILDGLGLGSSDLS